MSLKIYRIKFTSGLGTMLGSVVYNFHKHIPGVKTKKGLSYVQNGTLSQRLDVHFPADANCIYNKPEKRKKTYPTIIWYHGGGWACYSKTVYVTLSRRLAKMGFIVFTCNYRLAPKAKLANIMEDAHAALDYVLKTGDSFGADTSSIVFCGDSAGAHISAELAFDLKNTDPEAFGKLKGLGLFYGVYDLETVKKSGFPHIETYLDACVSGGKDNLFELEKYSPIKSDCAGLPPVFLASGEIDKLHKSQSLAFSKKLEEAGVTVKTKFYPKKELRAMHAYINFDGLYTNVDSLKAFENFLHNDLNLKGEDA